MQAHSMPYYINKWLCSAAISLLFSAKCFAFIQLTLDDDLAIDPKREAEILKALDELDKQLDLIEIDKAQQQLLNNKINNTVKDSQLNEEFEPTPMLEDYVEDLDIEEALAEDLDNNEPWSTEELDQVTKYKDINKTQEKAFSLKGKGKEEEIIYQLDKTDLIDIDKDLEILKKKSDKAPPILKEEELNDY